MKLLFNTFLFLLCLNKTFASQQDEMNTQFMPVFRQIVRFHEFLQNPEPNVLNRIDEIKISNVGKEFLRKEHSGCVTRNLKYAEGLLSEGESTLAGRLTVQNFLKNRLIDRFSYLLERKERAINTALKKDSIISSDPYFASFFFEVNEDVRSYGNKIAMKENITVYQFQNSIISSSYKVILGDKLDLTTIELLSCSYQIWPLLRGETYDLGHPDQASGFAIVKAYLGDKKVSEENLKKAAYQIINKVPCRKWEEIKSSIDIEIYISNFGVLKHEPKFIPFKTLGCKECKVLDCEECKGKGCKDRGFWMNESTPFELGEDIIPLPYPDFLKPKSLEQNKKKNKQPKLLLNEPSFFDLFPFEKLDVDETSESLQSNNMCAGNSSTSLSSQALLSDDNVINDNITIDENNNSINGKTEAITSDKFSAAITKKTETIKQPQEKQSSNIDVSSFTMPAGIRKFHKLMPKSLYNSQQLDKSQQNLTDRIFDYRQFQTVTFKDFSNLWEQLGGKVKNKHGGSHYTLFGPNKEVIGSTSSHGDAQTYDHKNIKYLRAALLYIACRPSSYGVSPN